MTCLQVLLNQYKHVPSDAAKIAHFIIPHFALHDDSINKVSRSQMIFIKIMLQVLVKAFKTVVEASVIDFIS